MQCGRMTSSAGKCRTQRCESTKQAQEQEQEQKSHCNRRKAHSHSTHDAQVQAAGCLALMALVRKGDVYARNAALRAGALAAVKTALQKHVSLQGAEVDDQASVSALRGGISRVTSMYASVSLRCAFPLVSAHMCVHANSCHDGCVDAGAPLCFRCL